MASLLESCPDGVEREVAAGTILIREGERSDCLYVLVDGTLEVFRGDVAFATVTEQGAVLGEMSVLLDQPHTASVKAVSPVRIRVIEQATSFLASHPELVLPIAQLLARRLQNASTYLVNLKQQFRGYQDHFGMIDEVLESIMHQQETKFPPPDDLPPDP